MLGLVFAVLSAIFIVEFAPERAARGVIVPVVRLLAAVPSVIYGLIGILVLVPFVGNHLVSAGAQGVGRSTSSSSPARACSSRS